MSQSEAVTLNDLAEGGGHAHLTVICEPCKREGRYLGARLITLHGDMGLPDVLALVTQNCPKHQAIAIHDRCHAVFKF